MTRSSGEPAPLPAPGATGSAAAALGLRELRDVLGQFPSGVTVVTAGVGDGPVGFTCQSFSALSLQPPLVLFCPSRTSRTWAVIRERGQFCINVLADSHSPLSQAFARSGADKFDGVDWAPSPLGNPVLDGVVAWLDCRLWAEYDGGDHTVVVAELLDVASDTDRPPLLFHRGAYATPSAPPLS